MSFWQAVSAGVKPASFAANANVALTTAQQLPNSVPQTTVKNQAAAAAAANPSSQVFRAKRGPYKPTGRPSKKSLQVTAETFQSAQEAFGTRKAIENEIAQLQTLLKLRAEAAAAMHADLARPGSLGGVQSVGQISSGKLDTPAEISQSYDLIGKSSATPDPRTESALEHSRRNVQPGALSPSNMGFAPAAAGSSAAVPSAFGPGGAEALAADRQLPSIMNDAIADALPTRSLFRRKPEN